MRHELYHGAMRAFGAAEIEAADPAPLVDAAEMALVSLARGEVEAPLRTALPLPAGTLLTMPGRLISARSAIVKLVSVMPGNARRGLPAIQGLAVLFDGESGTPIATFDGAALTVARTAAITAAALRRLGVRPRRLALAGAGAQAIGHARLLHAVFPVERIALWSPTPAHRAQCADRLAREFDLDVVAVDTVADAVVDADTVICVTTADRPFLDASMLAASVTVAAIGAFTPGMAEVNPTVFEAAGRVYVDDVAAVMHEGGDVLAAIRARVIGQEDVFPVGGEVDRGASVRLFKSVGSAAEDAAVAAAIAGLE